MSGTINYAITATDRATAVVDKLAGHFVAVNRRVAAVSAAGERFGQSLMRLGSETGINKLGSALGQVAGKVAGMAESLGRFAPALAGLTGAASLAGLAQVTSAWSEFGSRLGVNAARTGIAAQQLHGLQGAARLAGVSAEGLTGGMLALGDNLVNAVGGRAPEVVQMLGALGIGFQDATGGARRAEDVFPELADKIASIRNPSLQARAAVALFGGAGEELLPFLKRGSAGIRDYNEQAKKYGVMNEAGVEAARAFREEQTRLSLAVEGVGYTVSERLSPVLVPMLHQLSDWVAAHGDTIANRFSNIATGIKGWVDSGGLEHLLDALGQLGERMTSVFETLMKVVRASQSIGKTARDLFDLATGKGSEAAKQGLITGGGQTDPEAPRFSWPTWESFRGIGFGGGSPPPAEPTPAPEPAPSPARQGAESGGARQAPPVAATQTAFDTTLTPASRGLLDTIAGTESPGYNVRYGGARFSDYSQHPNVAEPILRGPNAGKTSSAAGRYQFLKSTWDEAAAALDLHDFTPSSQDRAAWWLAQRDYQRTTGRQLSDDINSTDPRIRAGIGTALRHTWTSLPGGIEQGNGNTADRFTARLDAATRAEREREPAVVAAATPPGDATATAVAPPPLGPAQVPPPTLGRRADNDGPRGTVDVTIAYQNAPAGHRAVVRTAGDVDYRGPRVEQSMPQTALT